VRRIFLRLLVTSIYVHLTGASGSEMSASQLLRRMTELQKIVNHPKCLLFQLERKRLQLKRDLKNAAGGQYALARLQARAQKLELVCVRVYVCPRCVPECCCYILAS
jgi:hypothetical protein